MGIEKALRDPLYAGSVAALVVVAVIAASLMLFSGESSAEPQAVVTPSPTNTVAPPQATPTRTATPSYGDILADTQRLLELAKVRDALASYFDENESYPSTGGEFETVCEEAIDSGCALREVDSDVPSGFQDEPFWYQSDGASYTLFARVAVAQAESNCPDEIPPALEGGNVACIEEGQP